jgi:hypothetical protein
MSVTSPAIGQKQPSLAPPSLQPSHFPQVAIGVPTIPITKSSVNQWINIDITNQVKDWVDGTGGNLNDFGLELVAADGISVVFSSKENADFSIPRNLTSP